MHRPESHIISASFRVSIAFSREFLRTFERALEPFSNWTSGFLKH
jgi:hypothetical protein